jgi:predicted  nucleic acid-binding Zn-ribbon protein
MTTKIDTHINEIQQEIDALNSQVEELQSRIAELQKMQSKLKDAKLLQKFEDKTSKVLTEAESLNVEIPSKEEFEKVYYQGRLTDQERKILWKLPYHLEEAIAEDQCVTKSRLSGIKSSLYKKFGLQGTPCQKTIALKAMSVMYLS